MSREAEGKITLAPNQRVVTVEQINRYVDSTQKAIDTVKALAARVVELEGALARYEGKKASGSMESPVRSAGAYSRATEAVKEVASELPPEVTVTVGQVAGLTTVTYRDSSGYARYFTADLSENASKLTKKGLTAWVGEKYMDSLDEQARKQGVR